MDRGLLGSTIDNKFLLQEILGEGGLGVVYKAYQQELSRYVAIKILHEGELASADSKARFEREAKVLSSIEHPHIVKLYCFGTHGEHAYIAMQYLEGKTLNNVFAQNSQNNWQRLIRILIQVCEALHFAHKHNIVHRDLKPENIILRAGQSEDFATVLDFGLSRINMQSGDTIQKLTQTGSLIGSVPYMSPEACLGERTDARSDVYSLACLLYEYLAGRLPFEAENPIGLLHKHVNEKAPSLPPSIPKSLQSITFKALAKRREDRFQSMAEFGDALRLVAEGRENELKLVPALPDQISSKQNITLYILLPILAIITFASYLSLKEHSNKINAKDKGIELPATGRAAENDRAIKLINEAKKYLAENNLDLAARTAHKATILITKERKDAPNADIFAKQDLSILTSLSPIILATSSKHYFDTRQLVYCLRRNDVLFLDSKNSVQLFTCFAELESINGPLKDAAKDYFQAIKLSISLNQRAKAQELMNKLKTLNTQTQEEKQFQQLYLDIARAELEYDSNKPEKTKLSTNTIVNEIAQTDKMNDLFKCQLLLDVCSFLDDTNQSKLLLSTSNLAKRLAKSFLPNHLEVHSAIAKHRIKALKENNNELEANKEIKYWKSIIAQSTDPDQIAPAMNDLNQSLKSITAPTQH
ncbi:MAG: serine/threonine protein kinase [Candidatus Obscuribacterales bacterium]|nr:serine/threonine protein kinase [Candidatus Obscuribacterales bacterium]